MLADWRARARPKAARGCGGWARADFSFTRERATVLFDPYLSDSLTKKYADTDKPHMRMTERVVAPERLTGIDIIASSHNHTDHLDAETLLPLLAANPRAKLLIPRANRAFVLERLGKVEEPARRIGRGRARHGGGR